MLLMGRRNFSDEIQAAQKMLMREKKKELYYLFLRNVKKLVRRFDYLLWQDDNRKLNAVIKFMDRLNELLGDPKNLNADLMSRSEEIISSDLVHSIDQLLPPTASASICSAGLYTGRARQTARSTRLLSSKMPIA